MLSLADIFATAEIFISKTQGRIRSLSKFLKLLVSGVVNQEDLAPFMAIYFFGEATCSETKELNQHMTQNVQRKYRSAVKELGIEEYIKLLEDKIERFKSVEKQETGGIGDDEHHKCAKRYEEFLLKYQNNILFTPPEKLKLLNKTHFNIYSCEIDILRDDTYVMVAMLESLNISHTHIHTENCYHASFNDNTLAGKILQEKVVACMSSL